MENWCLKYDEWLKSEESLRESLCVIGNGYFATRGAGAEVRAENYRYPGTYLAGGYNRLVSNINGRLIENEDFVNWPNWLCLNIKIENENWFSLDECQILQYKQVLDYFTGVLKRTILFCDKKKRETKIHTQRFVSMYNPHVAGIEWEVTPINWSGVLTVKAYLDGSVINSGVKRYRKLNHVHLKCLDKGVLEPDRFYLYVMTNQSEIGMAQAAKLECFQDGKVLNLDRSIVEEEKLIGQKFSLEVKENELISLKKTVLIYTTKDRAISHPLLEAKNKIFLIPPFEKLLALHKLKWKHLWHKSNISLAEMPRETNILRLHIFHILQTLSPNTIDLDVGTPSRGLHGEAYRGHIFWDEIYILPYINLNLPEVAKSLIMYRYRRLDEAKSLAKSQGFKGAMFPWQSGSSGREESQVLHLNPKSGRWIEDSTHRQRHINAAIVYNIWQYYETTADIQFVANYGAELCLEISKFWISIAEYNPERKRYEIKNVVGPDEFHTAFPGKSEPGIDNNAYTNFMASWAIRKSIEILNMLSDFRRKEVMELVDINVDDLENWLDISSKFYIPFHGNGIISQFEGYESLHELDWDFYRQKYGNIQRLDRILEAEGKSPNDYKLNKQADVLMLFYLFSAEEIQENMDFLGFEFDPESIPRNIHYYLDQSTNGSSLSRVVHAWVLSRSQRSYSWSYFQHALESDINDIQGGTTCEGIHLGAMAGTVDLITRCYTGITIKDDVLWFNPSLPDELPKLEFKIQYRGHWIRLAITHDWLHVEIEYSYIQPEKIGFGSEIYDFKQGDLFHFDLKEKLHKKVS